MILNDKRKALFDKIKGKPFIYNNIPCYVESESDIKPSYDTVSADIAQYLRALS